jgi:tetratricopeptide (TPR) repeat protein
MPTRLEVIQKLVAEKPDDAFRRYGLALELKNCGRLDEAAAEFAELERRRPEYVPQYLMHGNLLSSLKRREEARAVLERGIAAATKARDNHALSELRGALEALEAED